jgi:CCR4-NOT transcription complex subunit 4
MYVSVFCFLLSQRLLSLLLFHPSEPHPFIFRFMVLTALPSIASIQASSLVPSPVLSASDFPALPTSGETQPRRDQHHPFIAPRNPEPKPAPSVLRKIPPKSKVVLPPPPVKKIPIQKNSLNSGPIPTKSTLPEPPKPSEVPKSDTAESSYKRRDAEAPSTVSAQASNAAPSKPAPNHPSVPLSRPLEDSQAPILSKKAKKSKAAKPGKAVKDEGSIAVKTEEKAEETPTPVTNSEPPSIPNSPPVSEVARTEANPRESLLDRSGSEQTSLSKLLTQISEDIDLESLNFFNPQSVSPKSQTPLRYGPLVHALSALSVGGGSFANSIPSGSIDSAVSSFQLLLETLTQTISDLLRLLPRTTWDDSSSFDGVLRDMLKAEDFLEEHPEDSLNKEDEVAALTLALEKRARWMEVQLSKLEELHRDINSAAVRAILAFNQRGWDPASFLPRVGDSLTRFDNLGHVEEGEELRPMTIAELEASLTQVRAEEIAAEAALKKAMRINGEHLFV